MNAEAVTAVLILSDFCLQCEIATRGQRLLDVLNDGNTRFVQTRGGRLLSTSGLEPVAEIGETLVVKDNLVMALLMNAGAQSARSLFFATLERNTAQVVMTLPRALVRGEMHVKRARDAQTFLTVEAGNFIPVSNARVQYSNTPTAPLEDVVAMVNRSFISSLSFEN